MSETRKTTQPVDGPSAIEFMKRAVAMRLKLARIGSRRAVDTELVDTKQADKDLVKVTKEILDSKELSDIRNHDIETRAAIRRRALPSLLGSGWYLIPVGSVDTIDDFVETRKTERGELVVKLIDALPALKTRSCERLSHLWVEEQFPTPSLIREKCSVSTRYVTFDTPASLAGISKAILAREVAKAQQDAQAAKDAAVSMLRVEMEDAVGALARAFVPGTNGRRPGLKPATIAKVTEALDFFGSRNIAQDAALQGFVEQAKNLLAGKDAKSLNTETGVGDQFETIRKSIATLAQEGPSREIDFEE